MLVARGLTYQPATSRSQLWPPLDFDTGDATFVLLSGESGSGKSTLLRILCGLLPGFRGGRLVGKIAILSRPAPKSPNGRVGLLFQNTDAMLHSPRVADELLARAHAARQRDPGDLRRGWLAELIEQLDLGNLLNRRIVELSGGQQQRVAFAAVLAARPDAVLLDEPTSNLDPTAATNAVQLIKMCARRFGICFVAAEHKADHLAAWVDGALRLDSTGAYAWNGQPGSAPVAVLPAPLDTNALAAFAATNRYAEQDQPVLTCRRLDCRRGGRRVLHDIDLDLRAGEIVGLTGANGAGKSSLLLVLAGGIKPSAGSEITWHTTAARGPAASRIGLLLQNPLHQLFCDTVRHEVALAAENAQYPGVNERVDQLLEVADLVTFGDRATLSLSYGEQQRASLAATMSANPCVVLLDEPTHGMDARRLEKVIRFVIRARCEGTAFVFASHDRALLDAFCDRVLVITDGRIA